MTNRTVDNRLCRDGITDYNASLRCCGGTDGLAYKTLQGAIAASSTGDVITMRDGTYMGNYTYSASPLRQAAFYLNKAVTIEAWPSEQPILTYDPANPPIIDTADYGAILWVASNVTIKGLSILGTHALGDCAQDTDVAVRVQNGAGLTIQGCAIAGFGHCGIKADAGGPLLIEDCTIAGGGFTGRDHGIYISQPNSSGRTIIKDCEITLCTGYGVHLYGTPKNVNVLSCHIHHNGGTYTPANGGGVLVGGPGCLVEGCEITDNTGYGGLVLWKAASAGGAYLRNTILRNTPNNITLDQAAAPNVVYQNTRHAAIWTNTNLAAWADDGTDVIQ